MTTNNTNTTNTNNNGWPKKVLILGLCFTVGWANVISFTKYSTFGTMMTGNLVSFGQSIADGNGWNTIFYASVISSYLFGLSLY
mmetsp:Transcript_11515/g.13190  ORF Transcript_11515/g.13190 Transcript_11515/m.13190 type:complete len:84 (-) Transcript_11515:145-396(-)